MEEPLVLIIDDSDDVRATQTVLLEHHGFRIAEARDGREGLQQAHRLAPAVVLMDLTMPHMSGFELARRLKADPQTANIPIIAMTSIPLDECESSALKAGCASVIRKPGSPSEILVAIRMAISPAKDHAGAEPRRSPEVKPSIKPQEKLKPLFQPDERLKPLFLPENRPKPPIRPEEKPKPSVKPDEKK